MSDDFILAVNYKNQLFEFQAELVQYGYTHRINIRVNDQVVVFEPDEERNYRAIVYDEGQGRKEMDRHLMQAIVEKLEEHFK